MKKIIHTKASMMLLALMLAIAACTGSFEVRTYKTLVTLGHSYDAIMKMAADAKEKELISEETKGKIIDVGNVFYGSYRLATTSLEVYIKAKEGGANTSKERALLEESVKKAIADFDALAENYNSIATGIEGMKEWKKED